ncbi:MAG: TatD family hydrolase [Candidatus Marinimicrobia bacterium]|nr:TatD family hydrolase [Candidatus Neomarinimicrobiota bacterium]
MFIDTHAHLNLDPFYEDVQSYIDRALDAGVSKIIVPSIDLITSERAISLADKYDHIFAAVGVHPHDSTDASDEHLHVLEEMLKHPKVCAIGEIGLDYFRDYAPEDIQKRIFRGQIELAKDKGYPMIIHNREADADTYNILEETDYFNAQFHCYGSDEEFAQKILKKGALISFTGVVTFAKKVKELVKTLPLEKLMIETDCPWMAPIPHRGKQNEPAYVVEVAKTYGHIFNLPVEKIADITTGTAKEFFRIS